MGVLRGYTLNYAYNLPANSFTNMSSSSTTTAAGPTPSNCCFIVQDVVNEYWWDIYNTTSATSVVTLTSITVFITPGLNTTITNFETNVYTTNASTTVAIPVGQNPISLFWNNAPQPVEVSVELESSTGSQIVTAGVTMYARQ